MRQNQNHVIASSPYFRAVKFGKVSLEELDRIDFVLPLDSIENQVVLLGKPSASFEIYLGCSRWGMKEWVGSVYPAGTKANQFLREYAKLFNSIELSPTHYRIPTADQVEKWAETVNSYFRFCPKVYQAISHWDRLKDERGTTERFCESISHFGKNLGPAFLQMHPSFKYNSFETLEKYLLNWPKQISLALELRDANWFQNEQIADRLFYLMRETNTMAVITDTGGFRDLVHMRLSSDEVMIRFVGNGLHPSDYTRINDWVERIGVWRNLGLKKCWFFMHQHEELHSPYLIGYMSQRLNESLGLNLEIPTILKEISPKSTVD